MICCISPIIGDGLKTLPNTNCVKHSSLSLKRCQITVTKLVKCINYLYLHDQIVTQININLMIQL